MTTEKYFKSLLFQKPHGQFSLLAGFFHEKFRLIDWRWLILGTLIDTRPKPVGHGYVFSMAVGTIGEWLKLVPFFVRGRTVDWGGGGWAVFGPQIN